MLCEAFGSTNYDQLKSYLGNKPTDAHTLQEFYAKLSNIMTNQLIPIGLAGDYLIVTHLTRNYIGHGGAYEPEIYGSKFLKIYESLIFTLLTLYAKKSSVSRTVCISNFNLPN